MRDHTALGGSGFACIKLLLSKKNNQGSYIVSSGLMRASRAENAMESAESRQVYKQARIFERKHSERGAFFVWERGGQLSETLTYKEFYECAGVEQHRQFEDYLARIIFDKDEREAFYRRLLEINSKVSVDTFKPYFELYAAERKSFQQDYTPDAVTKLLAEMTRSNADDYKDSLWSGYDPTAGTGAMIIAKWHDDRIQESPWSYAPHNYIYRADELADNAIPYLIHNLTLRGMNAVVVHGDVLSRKVRNIYFIQNTKDDFLGFSDINVMPRSEQVERLFDVREWVGEPIVHVESPLVWEMIPPILPMQRKAREANQEPPKFETVHSFTDAPRVKDVAIVE